MDRCSPPSGGRLRITEADAGSTYPGSAPRPCATAKAGLDGGKIWIHNAPVGDFGCVLARTDPAAGHRGMSIFLVD